jgi:hypothetical protein
VAAHRKRKTRGRGVKQTETALWSYLIYYTACFSICQVLHHTSHRLSLPSTRSKEDSIRKIVTALLLGVEQSFFR